MTIKFYRRAALILLIPLLAAVIGDSAAADRGSEKVRIAVSSKSLGFLDTWAAKERGFYRQHGLDAEIIAMRPPLTIGALQAGEIDYAFGASTILRGSISGAPVRLVSLSLRTSFHTLVARPQFKSIADLKGKTIAVTIGAADDFVARHLIRRAGLDPRDYTFVNMGGSDTRFPALSIPAKSMRRHCLCRFSSSPNVKAICSWARPPMASIWQPSASALRSARSSRSGNK